MASVSGHIEIKQIGLGEILRLYKLRVPPNQREYSWTDKEVETLFHDLARAISEEAEEYFLGTIVTLPRGSGVLEVVDGQQRLSTTAILLAAIRDYLEERETMIAEDITNKFLSDIDRSKRSRTTKMQLNVDDNEFFRSKITKSGDIAPTKRSHELIEQTFKRSQKHVRGIIASLDKKDHGDALNKWVEYIQHKACVILLVVPSDINAYKMFETLNDRGLRTTQADLVKNYLFGQSDTRLTEAQQKWALMRGAIESLDEEQVSIVTFLRHALMLPHGFIRESEVYEEVQNQARGVQSSITVLDHFEKMAGAYVAIFNPEHEKWNAYPDSLQSSIKVLNLLNQKQFRPLLLAITERFSPNEASKAFQLLISLAVRLLIAAATRGGQIEEAIGEAAHLVFKKEIKDRAGLRVNLEKIIPGDEQFRQAFEIATVSKPTLARYYLRSLERVAKKEENPWFIPNEDAQTINLEHVLPEKPEQNWNQFSPEDVRTYCNRIGNLALLLAKKNSDLKSSEFETKRAVYKDASYVLTRQISTVTKWTVERIVTRQQNLATFALKAWPIDSGAVRAEKARRQMTRAQA